jgi:hypothetical protein
MNLGFQEKARRVFFYQVVIESINFLVVFVVLIF